MSDAGCTADGKPLKNKTLARDEGEVQHCKDVLGIVNREFGTKTTVTWTYFQKTSWPNVKGEFPQGTKAGDVWKKAVGGKDKEGTKEMFMSDAGCTADGKPLKNKTLARDEAQHCKEYKQSVKNTFKLGGDE